MKFRGVLFCSLTLLLTGCVSADVQVFKRQRVLMGTLVTISIYSESEPLNWQQDVSDAFEKMATVEKMTTSYNNQSEIGQINALAGKDGRQTSQEVLALLKRAQSISEQTDGAFDVTVLPLLNLWAFASEQPKVPKKNEIARITELVDYSKIVISGGNVMLPVEGMGIDLGAIAKGYAVDMAVSCLQEKDYQDFMVEAGGDLRAVAGEATRNLRTVWVRHPRNENAFFASIKMSTGAVATSGDYERYFEVAGQRYHHILDPKSGYPAEPTISVTIFANTTELADALSTAVFVLGPDAGLTFIEETAGIEGIIIFRDSTGKLDHQISSGIFSRIQILNNS